MRKAWTFLFLIAFLPLSAQPVFTADDLPPIGYEAEFLSDTSEYIIVDVGTTGGPQTWDFSREVEGETIPFEVLDPTATPVGFLFPDAEFVYHLAGTLMDTLSGEIWQYYKTTSTEMLMVGDYIESYHPILDSIKITHNYEPNRINSVFPLQMGAQWHDFFHTVDSLDPTGVFTIETTSSSSSRVDAWGTVITPADSFKALRYVTYDTTDIIVRIMAVPDTILSRTINYNWVAADAGSVTRIASLEDETDPQFDTAGTYMVLIENNLTPGIEETKMATSPEIRIRNQKVFFNTARAGVVELNLYDAGGRMAACLCHGILPSGEHSLPLPADLPRGVYFIRINTSGGTLSGKFVVLD
ncbi:MAG: T9SS type A sorting domain-containing protein [Candidatus Stahlbacteria bacterium]|nr:MAG: T9SS type A sorting domain-containing protein [Candidatus Stahlbacteria bacterium]